MLKIKFNSDISLSMQHLYHVIKKTERKNAVKKFEEVGNFFKTKGVVQEKDCECEKRTENKYPCSNEIEVKFNSLQHQVII